MNSMLTKKEAADRLRCSVKVRGSVRITEAEIERFLPKNMK